MNMKPLSDFINENNKCNFLDDYRTTYNNAPLVSLNESNAKRVLDKHSKSGFIIISPCRGYSDFNIDVEDNDAKQQLNRINNDRIKKMISIIKKTDYSYMPVYGGFIENIDTEYEEHVYERSFIIFNKDKKGNEVGLDKLFDLGIELCKKFNQDSFLFQKPGEHPKYYDKDGNLDFECGDKVEFNDFTQQYWTDLHKNTMKYKDNVGLKPTRFSFTECYVNPSPQNFSERYSRYMNQEIFIDTK